MFGTSFTNVVSSSMVFCFILLFALPLRFESKILNHSAGRVCTEAKSTFLKQKKKPFFKQNLPKFTIYKKTIKEIYIYLRVIDE